jgi:hypothetical protein
LRVPHARERGHEQHKRRKEEEEEEEEEGGRRVPPRGVSALAHLLNEVCVCARCLSQSHTNGRGEWLGAPTQWRPDQMCREVTKLNHTHIHTHKHTPAQWTCAQMCRGA